MLVAAPTAEADYGLETFSNRTTDAAGFPYAVAGGHPDQNTTEFSIPRVGPNPVEQLNGTYVTLPPGFLGNPSAAARCPIGRLRVNGVNEDDSNCPIGSRVGVADVTVAPIGGIASLTEPIYNIVPEHGYPAQFAFMVSNGKPTVLSIFPRSRSHSYGMTIGTPNVPAVSASSVRISFCGGGVEGDGIDPDSPVAPEPITHPFKCKASSALGEAPFLSNPVDCSETQPSWMIAIDSIEHAGALRELGVPDFADPDWKTASELAPPVTGCDDPLLSGQFDVSLGTKPFQGGGPAESDQPSGLAVELDFPQSNDPTDLNTTFDASLPQAPEPKDITVNLPAGLSISPSSADGLGACSDQASDPAGDQVHYDTTKPVTCPDSSKIGTAVATSPLLATRDPLTDEVNGAEPIPGDVYLLKPHSGDLVNGQGGKFRLLIALENPRYGVNMKVPGATVADKQTGQLTMFFSETPQLPASHLTVNLRPGPRAPLASPPTCGKFDTSSTLVPWSTPGTPDAHPSASFTVASGPNGTSCPASAAARPFAPTISAGTTPSVAGQSSPFTLRLDREDGEKELGSLDLTLPKGLSAKLAGIPACPEAALATAATRTGAAEQANPTCPASRLGTVRVGAGPGTDPFFATGSAYLAGPYKGAPMSVAVITPAVAGSFDLGNIVLRAAAYVDPTTAQVTVRTDPLPRILDGIPLRLRSIALTLDRPGFTRNPTSCEPMALGTSATAESGPIVALSQHFQVGGCATLPFRPQLSVRLSGALAHSGRPALRAAITAKPGQANIARAALTLPVTELLDYDHIHAVCTKSRYASGAGGGEACPPASRYGRVRLLTPLLDKPLEGPLYLRTNSSPRELPDLVASLGGEIHLDLVAHVNSAQGLLRLVFDGVPDVPVEKIVLQLDGGRRGLLVNTTDLCRSGARTSALFLAHNGKRRASRPAVNLSCGGGNPAGAARPRSTSIRRWGDLLSNLLG